MPEFATRSPLADLAPDATHAGARVRIEEARDLAKAIVRTHRSHAAAAIAAVKGATGLDLPPFPNTSAAYGSLRALWIEPGAWMLTGPRADIEAVVRAVSVLDGAPFILCTNVSSGRTAFRIYGQGARALLESGSALDLDPRAFGPGRCASTLFVDHDVVLDQIDEAPTYVVIGDRASARALWTCLVEAADFAP
jgi:sarcosine oxidase subunit gamma